MYILAIDRICFRFVGGVFSLSGAIGIRFFFTVRPDFHFHWGLHISFFLRFYSEFGSSGVFQPPKGLLLRSLTWRSRIIDLPLVNLGLGLVPLPTLFGVVKFDGLVFPFFFFSEPVRSLTRVVRRR